MAKHTCDALSARFLKSLNIIHERIKVNSYGNDKIQLVNFDL